jgi:hypothetical protein
MQACTRDHSGLPATLLLAHSHRRKELSPITAQFSTADTQCLPAARHVTYLEGMEGRVNSPDRRVESGLSFTRGCDRNHSVTQISGVSRLNRSHIRVCKDGYH